MVARTLSWMSPAVAGRIAAWTTSLLVALLAVVGFYGTSAYAASLPGGASSLQETYQDWQVSCVSQEDGAVCRLLQRQVSRENGQLLLVMEFMTTGPDGLSGNIVLPFGLHLGAGVTLQVDDGEPSQPLPFSTCLPQGCFVPIASAGAISGQMREGETLRLMARLLDGRTVQFSVSLKGFGAGLDRLQALEAGM